jgi:hypothetical protein
MEGLKEKREAGKGEEGGREGRNKGNRREKGQLGRDPFSLPVFLPPPAIKLPYQNKIIPVLLGHVCRERSPGVPREGTSDFCDLCPLPLTKPGACQGTPVWPKPRSW